MSETELIMNTLIALSDKIGIAATEISRIFIEAQPKIAMVNLTLAGIIIILTSISMAIVAYIEYNINHSDDCLSAILVAGIVTLVISIFIAAIIAPNLYAIVAPEYIGLKDMISTIRG